MRFVCPLRPSIFLTCFLSCLTLVALFGSTACANLAAYYPMNEGTNTTVATSVGSDNGTGINLGEEAVGIFYWDGDGTGKSGQAGDNSLQWTVADDVNYVDVPDSNALDFSTSMTASFWLEAIPKGGNIGILGKGSSYEIGINADTGSNGNAFSVFAISGGVTTDTAEVGDTVGGDVEPLPADTWTHVAYTVDNATGDRKIYVGGNLVAQDLATTPGIAVGTDDLNVGRHNHPFVRWPYLGGMDDVSLWDRALDLTEIQSLNAGTSPIDLDNLDLSVISWDVDSQGAWDSGLNWDPIAIPDANTTKAVLGPVTTSTKTIAVDNMRTVQAIDFNSPHGYAVAGTGVLTIESDDPGTTPSVIDVLDGDHEFQVEVKLNNDATAQTVPAGQLDFNNALNLNGQTLTIPSGSNVNINNSIISGSGGTIDNSGLLGGGGTVSGNLTSDASGTISVEILGSGPFDVNGLTVTGSAMLDGLLDVTGGFTPTSGTFDVLTAASINPASTIALTPAADAIYDLLLTATTLQLTVTTGDNADFDGSGFVDGPDFLIWQRNSGGAGTPATGDANGDNVVDGADLTIWETQYGGPPALSAGVAAVPEPSSVVLLLVAALAAASRRGEIDRSR